jgi:WD40 repeat protein
MSLLTCQWVRLAVEKINSCHTHSAVERALHEFPRGMEAIYDRMASAIAEHSSSLDTDLASAVLQCVTCAFRALTIEELLQALEGDKHEFLDIQESIKHVCSGFVVIDNDGNVAMIHETAREYLLGVVHRPFHVDRRQAHEQLFLSCMRCLMSSGLRTKVNQDIPDFASYSANWWSSHLAAVPADSEAVAGVINKFLTSHSVLTWIHILATELRLRILIQASKNVLGYVSKRKSHLPASIGKKDVVEQEQIETWAVDFVKIIGKFGAILRRNPNSIYKTIPPFCPHNSAIYQQFGRTEKRNLMVSGISTQTWDDSLARLSFGFGTYASSISAAGTQVAVLASSGKVSLFDTSIFEETSISPIRHGERTYRMELNASGTLLVTYGFKNTKVWEISTGECLATVMNPETRPRPLVISFVNNNNTLLVGSDDKQLRSLKLNEASPTWNSVAKFEEEELEGHFLNAASFMALSGDGSLMAVAYRGHPLSAWEVEGPYHIGHCWRAREEVARGEVVEAKWLPHSSEILGLYIEGVAFRWDPYGGEPEEINTGASSLTINGDGNLFATGDVRGTIKVYTTSTFHLIYQLVSQDSILGLAFSADNRRIYDVRGYYGNTWEPTQVVRYAERAIKGTDSEGDSESSSQESITPVNMSQRIDAITILAASPNGRHYCYGTECGRVWLFDIKQHEFSEVHTSKGSLSIEQVVWSGDGRYICFADSGKKLFVMTMDMDTPGGNSVAQSHCEVSLKTLTDGSIQQLLFQPDSSHLFVATSATLCTISLESKSIVRSVPAPEHDRKWIAHPQDFTSILGFGQNSVAMLSWNLDDRVTYRIERSIEADGPIPPDHAAASRTVERILATSDKQHLLVQMSRSGKSKGKEFLYFTTSSFAASERVDTQPERASNQQQQKIVPMLLPEGMTCRIGLALSFLKRDRLLFLSRSFAICSWEIPSDARLARPTQAANQETHENNGASSFSHAPNPQLNEKSGIGIAMEKGFHEIFSLPADWISKDCLDLCMIWLQERSLLCPRNGEVAVVRCSSFS